MNMLEKVGPTNPEDPTNVFEDLEYDINIFQQKTEMEILESVGNDGPRQIRKTRLICVWKSSIWDQYQSRNMKWNVAFTYN